MKDTRHRFTQGHVPPCCGVTILKQIFSTMLSIALLALSVPAWAQRYDMASSIDLATLTFTGVDFTLTPQRQYNASSVADGVAGLRLDDSLQTRPLTADSWVTNDSRFASMETVGSTGASTDATHFVVWASSTGAGQVDSVVERSGVLTAHQAGSLTMSVNYTFAHSAVPLTHVDSIHGWGGPQLSLGDVVSTRPLDLISDTVNQQGTLQVMRNFLAGEQVRFTLRTEVARSVPIPPTLWLLGLGLFAVGFMDWTRQQGGRSYPAHPRHILATAWNADLDAE